METECILVNNTYYTWHCWYGLGGDDLPRLVIRGERFGIN